MDALSRLPLAIELAGLSCVCIGAGSLAARRVPLLVTAGARVTIVAPTLHPGLAAAVGSPLVRYLARAFRADDTMGATLVLAATGVAEVDRAVAAEALAGHRLVCVASEPELGNCQFMATIHRGRLLIGLHSGGAAPAVTAALRLLLDASLPEHLGEVLEEFAALRRAVRDAVPDSQERTLRWRRVVEAGLIVESLAGSSTAAVARARALLLAGTDV